jgi:hypothetical protein
VEVQGPQLTAQRLLADADPALLPEPLHQVGQTPAHHLVDGRDRADLDRPAQAQTMLAA